jgi:Phage integrase family.
VSEVTGNRWHALWVLLARGGLRSSEARRLTWADVGEYSVTVRGRTKTRESKRTVRAAAVGHGGVPGGRRALSQRRGGVFPSVDAGRMASTALTWTIR